MEYLDKQKHAELQAEFDRITEILKRHDILNGGCAVGSFIFH